MEMFQNSNALNREAITHKYLLEDSLKKDSFIILVQRACVPCGKGVMSYVSDFFFHLCIFEITS